MEPNGGLARFQRQKLNTTTKPGGKVVGNRKMGRGKKKEQERKRGRERERTKTNDQRIGYFANYSQLQCIRTRCTFHILLHDGLHFSLCIQVCRTYRWQLLYAMPMTAHKLYNNRHAIKCGLLSISRIWTKSFELNVLNCKCTYTHAHTCRTVPVDMKFIIFPMLH